MSKLESYFVWVNCTGYRTYTVKAKSKEDAENEALKHFQCDTTEGELSGDPTRLRHPQDYTHEELEVFYEAEV